MTDNFLPGFTTIDWLILAGYFILLIVSGILLTRRQSSTDEYFRAGGNIPMWAAAISFLATSLSAATFIGGPQQAYKGDLTYLSSNIGSILAIIIVALFFIPVFYRHKVATVYGFLGRRYGIPANLAASGAFLIGRVFASGARLYIAALPASLILFGDIAVRHQIFAISILTIVGIFYVLAGGIRSVIWTDVIQTVVFVGAAITAMVLLLNRIPIGIPEILDTLKSGGADASSKLTIFNFGLDGFSPKHTYTVLTAIFGFSLLSLGAYGTDQDMTQRLLTCKSALKGSWSAVTGILVGLPVTALFMCIGLLLYIFYSRPELMGIAAPGYTVIESRQIFLSFILHEMPAGLTGLMMAGLFAAGLSSLNSAINAMSSSLVNDFYKRFRSDRSEKHYLKVSRLGVVVFGLILGIFAVFSVFWQKAHPEATLIDFALSVMVFAYSGLSAVFLTALFTKRGSNASVIAALLTGFGSVILMHTYFSSEIAFPWQMFIASGLAFGVCLVGSKKDEEKIANDERRIAKDEKMKSEERRVKNNAVSFRRKPESKR
ncbi:MAG: sodium:solute symporter [Candidatus Hatepunaea meridiana]|nr:sodium:solute symporter [Candidatus Hatepunaea meridiana]